MYDTLTRHWVGLTWSQFWTLLGSDLITTFFSNYLNLVTIQHCVHFSCVGHNGELGNLLHFTAFHSKGEQITTRACRKLPAAEKWVCLICLSRTTGEVPNCTLKILLEFLSEICRLFWFLNLKTPTNWYNGWFRSLIWFKSGCSQSFSITQI